MSSLNGILLATAQGLRVCEPDSTDAWTSVTYCGIVFDVNVYGGEFTDDGKFKACAYIVLDGEVDTSCGFDLGDMK